MNIEEVKPIKRPKLKVVGLTKSPRTGRLMQVFAPVDATEGVKPEMSESPIIGMTIDPETGWFKGLTRKDISRLKTEQGVKEEYPKTGRQTPRSRIYLWDRAAADFGRLEEWEIEQEEMDRRVNVVRHKNRYRARQVNKDSWILPHTKPELKKHNTEEPWRRKPEGNKRRGRG